MRALILPLLAATIAGCTAQPFNEVRTPRAQLQLDRLLAGKVAGAPISCLPAHATRDMTVVDDQTILFRDGSNRIYRNDPRGGCPGASRAGSTLIIRQFGGSSLCSGEIVQVADLTTGFSGGSCSLGDFVPYVTAGRR
jgi:hypothetical protein